MVSFLQIAEEPAETFHYYVPSEVLRPLMPELIKRYGAVFSSETMTTEEHNSLYSLTWDNEVDGMDSTEEMTEIEDAQVVWTEDRGNEHSKNMLAASDIVGQTMIVDAIVSIFL